MSRLRITFIWIALATVVAVPIGAAAMSPLLEWRDPIYIVAGFAGVIGLVLMLFQPMLAIGYLPGFSVSHGRRVHRWIGVVLVLSVVVHVSGLWITSPPDVIDALLFVSPTPFSVWGVIAMWGIFISACLVAFRCKLHLRPLTWRMSHRTLAAVIVVATIVHAMLIDGTMETLSKAVLCAVVLIATMVALVSRVV